MTKLERSRLKKIKKRHPDAKPMFHPCLEIGYKILVVENDMEIAEITDDDFMIAHI